MFRTNDQTFSATYYLKRPELLGGRRELALHLRVHPRRVAAQRADDGPAAVAAHRAGVRGLLSPRDQHAGHRPAAAPRTAPGLLSPRRAPAQATVALTNNILRGTIRASD